MAGQRRGDFKELIPKFLEEKIVEIEENYGLDSKEYYAIASQYIKIERENYAAYSLKKILECLKKYYLAYEEMHIKGWLGNASDIPDMLFTKHLLFMLREKIRKKLFLFSNNFLFRSFCFRFCCLCFCFRCFCFCCFFSYFSFWLSL